MSVLQVPSPHEDPGLWYAWYLDAHDDIFSSPMEYEEFCSLDEAIIEDIVEVPS